MKTCSKCQLPETYETIEYDFGSGECNICKSYAHKKDVVDWDERRELLSRIIEKNRGKYSYDCIVPFSGGKDSTYTLYYLVKEFGIKPLVVRFNHGFMRDTIQKNNVKTFKKLGVDVIEFTPNWHLVKRLMLESFKRKTDFCWHCHTGIYSYPIRVALMYKVPLVFWGEPQSEITAYYDYLNDEIEYEDDKKFNMLRTLGITAEDMYGMISHDFPDLEKRDLIPYTFPDIAELRDLNYMSVPLGSFIPWDYKANTEVIKKELGWETDELEGVPDDLNPHGEKIECYMQGTRDFIKYLKRGYGRVTQINAFDVRSGRMSPEQAKKINEEYDGRKPPSLDLFLEYVGLTEEEFYSYVETMRIPPFEIDPSTVETASKTWDFEDWYRDNGKP